MIRWAGDQVGRWAGDQVGSWSGGQVGRRQVEVAGGDQVVRCQVSGGQVCHRLVPGQPLLGDRVVDQLHGRGGQEVDGEGVAEGHREVAQHLRVEVGEEM